MEHNEVIRVVSIKRSGLSDSQADHRLQTEIRRKAGGSRALPSASMSAAPRPGGHQAAHRRWSGCQYHQPRRLCQASPPPRNWRTCRRSAPSLRSTPSITPSPSSPKSTVRPLQQIREEMLSTIELNDYRRYQELERKLSVELIRLCENDLIEETYTKAYTMMNNFNDSLIKGRSLQPGRRRHRPCGVHRFPVGWRFG